MNLRLAVADFEGQATEPYVRLFIDEVAARTDGSVSITPAWDAGSDHPSGFERGVANLVVDGKAELGLAGARGWDDAGVTSLQALQAPFVISDDALAVAVAESPIASDMLAGMRDGGVEGLAMWPEGLRHLFTWEHCTEPIVRPDQLAGLTVRTTPSGVTWGVVETLGATPVFYNGIEADVDACELQALESQLSLDSYRQPTATGDVVLYTKYQVLGANADAFARLSDAQRAAIVDAAAVAAERAIAERPTEADAAQRWCAEGGRVVFAGEDGVRLFQEASRPVYERLAKDPLTGASIEAIEGLKATVQAAPGAIDCEALADVDGFRVMADTTGYSGELPPAGSYRGEFVAEDMMARGSSYERAHADAGIWTVTFGDGTWEFLQHRTGHRCSGPLTSVDGPSASGKAIRLADGFDGGCGADVDLVWRLDEAGMDFLLVDAPWARTEQEWIDARAAFEGVVHVRVD